jgi:protein-tyrosine kinase
MGRIDDALSKVKTSGSGSSFAPSGVDQASTLRSLNIKRSRQSPVFEELSESASYFELDADVLKKNRVTSDDQLLSVRSAYKMLRTRLLQRMRANNWNTLAISSARSNAGKTLTAINTAISISHEPNRHVILVDLDLRRPSIAKYLGIEPQHDLSDYLLNDVPIEKVVIRTGIERLLIIPNTAAQEYSSELLTSAAMQALAERLSNDAGGAIVIYDLPPMLDADDMLAFSPQVDALLFIAAECETRRADLQQVSDLIEDLDVIGVILNKSDDDSPAYY